MNPDYRELFPHLAYRAYLNHASLTPPCTRVIRAMETMAIEYARTGVSAWRWGSGCRRKLREKLGLLIGAPATDLGLIQNTSHGLMIVANEYPWSAGDRLVLFQGEFPGNIVPWLAAAERYGLEVIWLQLTDLLHQSPAFLAAMARNPKLMALSWVQFQTGLTMDLSYLSHIRQKFQIHICLDAIQGLGPLTMNLRQTPLDFVVCGGHKWLMAPEGTGFIYVRPERMSACRPLMVSWLSQEEPATFLYLGANQMDYFKPIRKDPTRYEMGTVNNIGYAGMEAAVDLLLEVGPEHVSGRVLELAAKVRSGFEALGQRPATSGQGAGIVTVALPDQELFEYAAQLERQSIAVATPDGHLRVSAHFYNDEEDLNLFFDALGKMLHRS